MNKLVTLTVVAGLAGLLASGGAALAQQPSFADPEAALEAFREALFAPEGSGRLLDLLGEEHGEALIGADPATARQTMAAARNAAGEALRVVPGEAPDTYDVLLGRVGWPLPIPLARGGDGWFFDTEAGLEEMIDRRIGENELAAIAAARAYVEAQRLYGSADRNDDGVLEFAQRLISNEGQRDGLFWPTAADQDPSPLGPLAASEADYLVYYQSGEPYYGYNFRILTRQGEHAPGGAYDYMVNGRLLTGYGLLAWPADYGNSGIMTFMVNHLGNLQETDLGERTPELAAAIVAYDPGPDWLIVED
jgi:hypothetical protein